MPFTFTYFGLLTHVHETLDTYSSPQIPSCSFPAVLPKNSLALPQPLGLGSSCPHAWCSFALLIIQWSFRSHQFRNKNIKNSTKIQVIPVRPYQFPLFQKKQENRHRTLNSRLFQVAKNQCPSNKWQKKNGNPSHTKEEKVTRAKMTTATLKARSSRVVGCTSGAGAAPANSVVNLPQETNH